MKYFRGECGLSQWVASRDWEDKKFNFTTLTIGSPVRFTCNQNDKQNLSYCHEIQELELCLILEIESISYISAEAEMERTHFMN